MNGVSKNNILRVFVMAEKNGKGCSSQDDEVDSFSRGPGSVRSERDTRFLGHHERNNRTAEEMCKK
jgi:hypothetical protein